MAVLIGLGRAVVHRFRVLVVRQGIEQVCPFAFLATHWLQLLGLAPAFEEAAGGHVLILEFAHAFVIRFGHKVRGHGVPVVGELDVAKSALISQRLEILLG